MEAIQTFMTYHVYAVWDFMSVVKSLQVRLGAEWIQKFNISLVFTAPIYKKKKKIRIQNFIFKNSCVLCVEEK